MTNSNNEIEAVVEISGIQSYQLQIPATITTNFIAGEILTGSTSGASAEVVQTTLLTDTSILIKNRFGFFEVTELITSTSGFAVSNGSTFNEKALYNNSDFDIVNGLWTIDSTESQAVKFGNATSTINIDDGGNFSTGNNFSIEVTNFGLTKAIFEDGVFLEGLDVKLFIDLGDGAGSEQRWTGKTQTYTKSGKATAQIKCIDAGKQRNEKMGSDTVPIALNLNYNCKLPYDETLETTYEFSGAFPLFENPELDYGFVNDLVNVLGTTIDPTVLLVTVLDLDSNFDQHFESNFNEGYIYIISGKGSGSVYKIYDCYITSTFLNSTTYAFSVNEDVSNLRPTSFYNQSTIEAIDVSVMRIISSENVYTLSQNRVNEVHEEITSLDSKTVTITDSDLEYEISSDGYTIPFLGDSEQVNLLGVKEEKSIALLSEKPMDHTGIISTSNTVTFTTLTELHFSLEFNMTPLSSLDDLIENNSDMYFNFKRVTLKNVITGSIDSIGNTSLDVKGYYKDLSSFPTDTIQVFPIFNTAEPLLVSYEISGNDIFIDIQIKKNLDDFRFENYENLNSLISNISVVFNTSFISSNIILPYNGDYEFDGVSVLYGGDLSLSEISVGCSGENAYKATQECTISSAFVAGENVVGLTSGASAQVFEDAGITDTVLLLRNNSGPFTLGETLQGLIAGTAITTGETFFTIGYTDPLQTLKYLMVNYMGVPLSNIDLPSFTQANEDFALFSSATTRNACHQITGQTDVNKVMKDLLYTHHLGLFYAQDGKYTAENWLPKSVVFSDSPTVYDFDSTDWESISDIDRSTVTKVINDYQSSFNLNESTGDYEDTIRIKNTGASSFDFDTCTEGIDPSFTGIASEAWELLSSGFKRINRESQRVENNDWIKKTLNYSADSTKGQGEAIAFIRNLAGHINRNLEKVTITVPFTKTYLDIDLLSFISITEKKLTSNKKRTGWIINRVINYTTKRIKFKILLDIDLNDPFLVQIGIIQDTFDSPDEIDDVSTGTDIITDGQGN